MSKRGAALISMQYRISKELGAVLGGATTTTRPQALKGVWAYIKSKDLQNPAAKREIIADPTLMAVFGQKNANIFQVMKLMNPHFLGKV